MPQSAAAAGGWSSAASCTTYIHFNSIQKVCVPGRVHEALLSMVSRCTLVPCWFQAGAEP